MTDYSYLKQKYPPTISADQFYRICHISKRKAKWLLENDVIPCKDSGKKTRRFTIQLTDIIAYLELRETSSSTVSTPPGIFSSGWKATSVQRISIEPSHLRHYFDTKWQNEPDVISIKQVTELIGYSAKSISGWIASGRLNAVWYKTKYLIPKFCLIEFLVNIESYNIRYYPQKYCSFLKKLQKYQDNK